MKVDLGIARYFDPIMIHEADIVQIRGRHCRQCTVTVNGGGGYRLGLRFPATSLMALELTNTECFQQEGATLNGHIHTFLLSPSRAQQLSLDAPAYVCLCGKASALCASINLTPYQCHGSRWNVPSRAVCPHDSTEEFVSRLFLVYRVSRPAMRMLM